MASPFGPWDTPVACNTSSQCDTFLKAETPGASGLAVCFQQLRPAGLVREQAFGGCACSSVNGLGGVTCNEFTEASPMVITCSVIAVVVCLYTMLKFSWTTVHMLIHRSVWKFNAAGVTYILCWMTLCDCLSLYVAGLASSLHFTPAASSTVAITGRIQIIFIAVTVLNLTAAFIEMSSSVRLIQNVDKLRYPMFFAIFSVSMLVIFTFLFTPTIVSALIGFVVVLFLTIAGVAGPGILYVRASTRMAKAEQIKVPTYCDLFKAVCSDVCCESKAMKRLLGFSNSESSQNYVKGSREPSPNNSTITGGWNMRSSQRHVVRDAKSIDNKPDHVHKREEKMVSFLSRAVNMGVWLGTSLLIVLSAVAAGVVFTDKFETGTYRAIILCRLFQDIEVVSAVHQILWFLNPGYVKAIKISKQATVYKSESKDVLVSKDLASKDDTRQEKETTNNSGLVTTYVSGHPSYA